MDEVVELRGLKGEGGNEEEYVVGEFSEEVGFECVGARVEG